VIFIEINDDKIINAFTKNFFVNAVNVYHIYAKKNAKQKTPKKMTIIIKLATPSTLTIHNSQLKAKDLDFALKDQSQGQAKD